MQKQLILTGLIPVWRRGQARFLIAQMPSARTFFGTEWRSAESERVSLAKMEICAIHLAVAGSNLAVESFNEEKANDAKPGFRPSRTT
jgi:hypothetical protein